MYSVNFVWVSQSNPIHFLLSHATSLPWPWRMEPRPAPAPAAAQADPARSPKQRAVPLGSDGPPSLTSLPAQSLTTTSVAGMLSSPRCRLPFSPLWPPPPRLPAAALRRPYPHRRAAAMVRPSCPSRAAMARPSRPTPAAAVRHSPFVSLAGSRGLAFSPRVGDRGRPLQPGRLHAASPARGHGWTKLPATSTPAAHPVSSAPPPPCNGARGGVHTSHIRPADRGLAADVGLYLLLSMASPHPDAPRGDGLAARTLPQPRPRARRRRAALHAPAGSSPLAPTGIVVPASGPRWTSPHLRRRP